MDLRAARWNTDGGFFSTVCFRAQQAAEKVLKSLLYYHRTRREALLTRSTVEMLRMLTDTTPGMSAVLEDGRLLDLHHVPSRYPNGLPSGYPHEFYGSETASQAMAAAERILQAMVAEYRRHGEEDMLTEKEPSS